MRGTGVRHRLGSGSGPGWAAGLGATLILAAAPASAQGLDLKPNNNLPIEITADRLEVLQPDRVATFSGKVDAVQGDMVLSADQLKVFYYGKQDARTPAPAAAAGSDPGGSQPGAGASAPAGAAPAGSGASGSSIRRIEAEGNVFLSSPRETAQGKTGVYDVAGGQLTLEGSVVLTQGDDVIRGDRLEVDLATGHSRVLAALPSSDGGTAPQRVRALFIPGAKTPEQAAAAEAKVPVVPAAPAAKPKANP